MGSNIWQNIGRLFRVLAKFIFTTSAMELDYYHQKVNVRVASQVAERLKTFPEHPHGIFADVGALVLTQEKKKKRLSLNRLDLMASTQLYTLKPSFDLYR